MLFKLNKLKNIQNHSSPHSLLVALIAISTVAGIGAYMVFTGSAQTSGVPDNAIVISGQGNTALQGGSYYENDTTYDPGTNSVSYNHKIDFQKGQVPFYFFSPSGIAVDDGSYYGSRQQPEQWHLAVRVSMYVQVTEVICATGFSCQVDAFNYSAGDGGRVDKQTGMQLCINMRRQDFNKAFTLFTLKVDPTTAVRKQYEPDWIVQPEASQNNCVAKSDLSVTDNQRATNWLIDSDCIPGGDGVTRSGHGTCNTSGARGGWGVGASGAGDGTGGNSTLGGQGASGTGSGNAGSGTGPGGGGGGSSATKQSDKPNAVISTSSQGLDDSTKSAEPSPFFDGKQYEPGSSTDTVANAVSITGKNIIRYWYIVLGIIVAIAGGSVVWMHRKNN